MPQHRNPILITGCSTGIGRASADLLVKAGYTVYATGMREAGGGLVLNVGSMGGRIAFPVGGYYHATKYAVEGLTDALRNEVREFGIAVSLIEPGPIRTNFEESINSSAAVDNPNSPYAALVTKVQAVNADAYASKVLSVGPEAVARTILKAVEAQAPKSRYLVTPAARAMVHARRLGGDRVWDAIIGQQFR